MSKSLRDQLLGLGYQPAPKPERPPSSNTPTSRPPPTNKPSNRPPPSSRPPTEKNAARHAGKPAHKSLGAGGREAVRSHGSSATALPREEFDLGKAYALRAQKEKNDRIEAERQKQEEARKRREAKGQLSLLLKDKALNDPAAEIARHFEYGGKIKRIHVTAEQLSALNAGALGVAQVDGRYLLITAALLIEAEAIFPPVVALKVDPNAPATDNPYDDPAYQIPDDLVW